VKLPDISGNQKKAYLRAKFEEIETNSKIKTIGFFYRGISVFKKVYQPRCNIVKYEKGDMVAESNSIVVRWRKYFSQLFKVHGIKEVGQAEIHTAEPLVPEPSASELEMAIGKLKSHKSPGIDQIMAEMIKAARRKISLEIHNLLLLIGRRNCLKFGSTRS